MRGEVKERVRKRRRKRDIEGKKGEMRKKKREGTKIYMCKESG